MTMKRIYEKIIPPKNAIAYRVNKGDLICITDLEGKQTCDFVAFNGNNIK